MSEAELHVLRARLNGGIRNKAARGELRRGLPVGFVWGEADGEVRLHPDEAVVTAVRSVFARFAEMGSARRVWLWFRSERLTFPLQLHARADIRWVEASYTAIHQVLTNPVYAGAYVYGKTRQETILDGTGARKKRIRFLPRYQWQVLIPEHHPGFIDWQTYEANQQRLAANTRPQPHKGGGAVRGRRPPARSCQLRPLRPPPAYPLSRTQFFTGYHCAGKVLVENRGVYCLNIGGVQIDDAITQAFIAALEPAKLAATLTAAERLEADRQAALKRWRLAVERASYEAQRAERRYRAVDPDNRLEAAKADLARREATRPHIISQQEHDRLLVLGPDLISVWNASTTTPRDRKELLRTHRRGHHQSRSQCLCRPFDAALEGRCADRDRSRPAPVAASDDPHGRGHRCAPATTGRALFRCCNCRHPQPAGPHDRLWPPLRPQPRR
ncbi:recombinase family protein [Bradyrhizobium sp. CB3481]|uniref:recombinase family protein n=1 Tax=Bradyrhizobium sp. CB3481 TaxID=3039158 RepID=UPI0024B24BF8|nr:recombinase family protein [Bradyrhizobium sp. CB3481]WFU14640.1 recombinase family protein [Bradyrhizobium sp. CB3481]